MGILIFIAFFLGKKEGKQKTPCDNIACVIWQEVLFFTVMCLMPIRNKLYHILHLCTEYLSEEKQYFWGLKTPSTSGARFSIQKDTSTEVFITRFPIVVNLSWNSFWALPHFHMQGTVYCSCVVVFCLAFSFCASFQHQDPHNSSLLSTDYPLRDILHPLWYSINTLQLLNSNVSLKDSCNSDYGI